MKTSTFRGFGLAIVGMALLYGGPATAKDKYVECIDPDFGKSCMECNQGGTQVCCPEHGTCTVNKLIGDSGSDPSVSARVSAAHQCANDDSRGDDGTSLSR